MSGTTFDPNTQLPPASLMRVDSSAFKTVLETIAPGVTALINQTQSTGEQWPQTLVRLIPSLQATDEQRQLLMREANLASNGQNPEGVQTSETETFPTWAKWGLGIGAALILLG